MALETMRDVTEINGEKIGRGTKAVLGTHIYVENDDAYNQSITFFIQNGPIKEVGKNGCQVEDIIAVAEHMIRKLNEKFPCEENFGVAFHLKEAINWSKKRTANRQARQVEGTSKL